MDAPTYGVCFTERKKNRTCRTSNRGPNEVLRTLAMGCQAKGHDFIVIGDVASPADFQLEGCRFYGLQQQYETG